MESIIEHWMTRIRWTLMHNGETESYIKQHVHNRSGLWPMTQYAAICVSSRSSRFQAVRVKIYRQWNSTRTDEWKYLELRLTIRHSALLYTTPIDFDTRDTTGNRTEDRTSSLGTFAGEHCVHTGLYEDRGSLPEYWTSDKDVPVGHNLHQLMTYVRPWQWPITY